MSVLRQEQEKILKKLEEERLAEEEKQRKEREKIAAKKKAERERKRKEAEKAKAEAERLKKEEEERKRLEAELAAKKAKFRTAKETEKVFDTKGQAGKVSYDDLMNGFIAKIEAVAKTSFGLPFLKELVKRGELNYEKALTYYLKETKAALKQGLAKKTKKEEKKKKVDYILYDFEYVLQNVLKSMGLKQPEYVDEARLKKRFEQLVKRASRNNILERIILGEPFLEF